MCTNKLSFETKKAARIWLKGYKKENSKKARVYQCECGKFHFTSGNKAENRRWRKRKRQCRN